MEEHPMEQVCELAKATTSALGHLPALKHQTILKPTFRAWLPHPLPKRKEFTRSNAEAVDRGDRQGQVLNLVPLERPVHAGEFP
jgi:hypothetical protein